MEGYWRSPSETSASYISLEQPTEGGRRRNLHYTKKKKKSLLSAIIKFRDQRLKPEKSKSRKSLQQESGLGMGDLDGILFDEGTGFICCRVSHDSGE